MFATGLGWPCDNFDARKIARYTRHRIEWLLADPGIIRNASRPPPTSNSDGSVLYIHGRGDRPQACHHVLRIMKMVRKDVFV
jgi:hypothetical protein